MKKSAKLFLTAVMAVAACGLVFANGGTEQAASGSKAGASASKGTIGVVMPTRSEERWNKDGNAVKQGLEKLGYKVDLQFSDDQIPTQVNQIQDMIMKGEKCLVIASIDGSSLGNVLEQAHEAKIPVISYDRLLMKSPYVNYYVTFDNEKVGEQMGQIVVQGMKLDQQKPGAMLNIELFGGSPDDNNAVVVYKGAMKILKPYFDKKIINVPSGQTEFSVIATQQWQGSVAQSRMENLLSAYYTQRTLNGVLSPYDPISLAVIEACKAVGYKKGDPQKPLPIAGGQDCIVASCKSILAGEQYATVLKDTRKLGAATVTLVDEIMTGKTPQGLDTEQYKNGAKTADGKDYIVPTLMLPAVIVTKDNLMKEVVDTGYHTKAELGIQ
jgi:putative multiple sugar transport system substrate-binding protein